MPEYYPNNETPFVSGDEKITEHERSFMCL